jgi:hypothetical protein
MRVRGWMRANCNDYKNATELSEACADALDIYENFDYEIPQFVFEIALDYILGERMRY